MTTTLHKRSAHIDAPVETVFDYVKDPYHFYEAWKAELGPHSAIAEVRLTPEGSARPSG